MKRILASAFTIVVAALLVAGCKGDKPSVSIAAFHADTPTVAATGWIVSLFIDKNENRTADFNGYAFNFEKPRNIVAMHNGLTENGILREMAHDSVDDYELVYAGIDPNLAKLSGEWEVVANTTTELDLKHQRAKGLEEIHFTKGVATDGEGKNFK